MGRKKDEERGGAAAAGAEKSGKSSKDAAPKKERLSVSAFLSNIDKPKSEKPAPGSKGKPKAAAKSSGYVDLDLPSSDEEEEEVEGGEGEEEQNAKAGRRQAKTAQPSSLDVSVSEREAKKKEKEMMMAVAQEAAKQEALKDDGNGFSVVIGARTAAMDGEDAHDANMKDIKIDSFSVSARGKELLKNTALTIVHGRRYGLVGPNGEGKSTLLKLLAWRQIPVPKNIDVLLVEQEVVGDDKTALMAVVSANEELMKLREEAARLQELSSKDDKDDDGEAEDAAERLTEVYESLQAMDSDAAEARATKILAGLGFTTAMQARSTKSFSGGWRMRISLARALFVQPTLLLLDEPTNYLDSRALIWLEEYLMRWKKTLIVVSHDRDFLNSVSTDIIHLHDEKLHFYKGNFGAFEEMYEQKRRENNKKFEIYEKQLKAAKRSGKNIDVGVDMGTRVAIVGPNGASKSTLLNLFAGDLQPTEGDISIVTCAAVMVDNFEDLPALVHSHCVFFDKLVEFIPSKFYIQNEEAHDTWTFKKNKAAKAAAKIQTRENLKKAKRNRLDPDQFKSTLQVLQEKKEEAPKEKDGEAEPKAKAPPAVNADRTVTYEELRERLHKRISMLRAKRHAETAAAATMNARSFQNEKKNETLKRRLNSASKEPGKAKAGSSEVQPPNKRQKKSFEPVEIGVKKDAEVEVDELEFSRVKMGLDNAVTGSKKKKRGTKEQLLKKATELQEKMQDPENGQVVISQHSWAAAVSRAAGEKVLDNPKLIKKSMKKEQHQAQKSAKKWQERKNYEKRAQNEKQKTRKHNITQRLESIKERKIAKREKKLMRPGFEGRKAGFINS